MGSASSALDRIVNNALLVIGLNTGLDRQSISLLKWENVNLSKGAIELIRSKTDEPLFIPLSGRLKKYIAQQRSNRPLEGYESYITPELAKMYIENPDGISYRFKKMLSYLGIKSVSSVKDRTRKVSKKDIHSLRHTFCYLHGIYGTPIRVIQSMVGHMTPKMTEAYALHETETSKAIAVRELDKHNLIGTTTLTSDTEIKDEIIVLYGKLSSNLVRQELLKKLSNLEF